MFKRLFRFPRSIFFFLIVGIILFSASNLSFAHDGDPPNDGKIYWEWGPHQYWNNGHGCWSDCKSPQEVYEGLANSTIYTDWKDLKPNYASGLILKYDVKLKYWAGSDNWHDGLVIPVCMKNGNLYSKKNAWLECERPDGYCQNGEADSVGNPCNIRTGNKTQVEEDFSSQGAHPLSLVRFYNSGNIFLSSLGMGWRTNFDAALYLHDATTIYVNRPDGRSIKFTKSGGVWGSNASIQATLVEETSGDYTFTREDNIIETFDSTGRLTKREWLDGHTQTLTYTGTNPWPDDVTDSYGRSINFTYDTTGTKLLATATAPDGAVYTYARQDGEKGFPDILAKVVYPDNTSSTTADNPTREFIYDGQKGGAFLTAIIDENGVQYATFAYDDVGNATSTEHAGAVQKYTIVYDDVNNTRDVTGPLGEDLDYTYTTVQGALQLSSLTRNATATQPAATETRTYDSNGYPASRTGMDGVVTNYTYNASGFLTSRTDAYGTADEVTTTFSWHSTFRLPIQIVSTDYKIDFTYDSSGKLTSRTITDTTSHSVPYSTNGQTRTWAYSYNTDGTLASVDGPLSGTSDTTSFTYDVDKNISTITNPLGHVIEVTSYDDSGRPLTIEDENNVATVMTYTPRGWLETITVNHSSGNATTRLEYDGTGNLLSITSPLGVRTSYVYDDAHRLVAMFNGAGDRVEFTLDNMGNATATLVKNASGTLFSSQTAVFNEFGWLIEAFGASSQKTTFGYDSGGYNTSVTDPLNNTTNRSFDALGRVISTTDALSGVASATFDDDGLPLTVNDQRALQTSFVYNGFGDVIQLTSPDTGTEVYTYDSAGNLTSKTDSRSVVTNFTYDALGRVTAVSYPGNSAENVTYTYDSTSGGNYGIGRLTGVTDQSGSASYAYDHTGSLISESKTIGTRGYTTAYEYDLDGNVTSITYPSGRIVNYARDINGRVTGVATQSSSSAPPVAVVTGISYKPFGRFDQITLSNGITIDYGYNLDARLASIVAGDGVTNVQDLVFAYDNAGNATSITDGVTSANTQSMTYDALWRLTQATGVYGTISYTYDAVGNRTSRVVNNGTIDTETYTYSTTSNQLTSMTANAGTRSFTYNADGNMATDNRYGTANLGFLYNQAGRYYQKQLNGSPDFSYTYNAYGERVIKNDLVNTILTHFHYSSDGALLGASDGSTGAAIEDYIFLDGILIAKALPPTGTPGPGESVQVDNEDAGFSGTATWSTEAASDVIGLNHRVYSSDPTTLTGAIMVDNTDSGFFARSLWVSKTGSGHEGSDYLTRTASITTPFTVTMDIGNSGVTTYGSWSTGSWWPGYIGSNYSYSWAYTLPVDAVVIDNSDAAFSYTGTASLMTFIDDQGSDALFIDAGFSPTGGVVVDNGDTGFSTTGTWTTVTTGNNIYGTDALTVGSYGTDTGALIIDNNTTYTITAGSWTKWNNATAYNGSGKYNSAGTGAHFHQWHFEPPADGWYEVLGQWYARSSDWASDSGFNINHANGRSTVWMSQKANGGVFNSFGVYYFRSDVEAVVELNDKANKWVFADAIKLRPLTISTFPTATWTPTLPSAGKYAVYIKYRSNRVEAQGYATYTVSYDYGTAEVPINQKAIDNPGWRLLGSFDMTPGQGHGVTLTARGNADADAVMFVNIDSASPAGTATWSIDPALSGSYDVYGHWPSSDLPGANVLYTITHAGGTTITYANQRAQQGFHWNYLGTYNFAPSSGHKVELLGTGARIADAIYYKPAGSRLTSIEYIPALPFTDSYLVEVNFPNSFYGPKNTDYTVIHVQGETTIPQDQQNDGGTWQTLGIFDLTPSSGHGVRLTNDVTVSGHQRSAVFADAVRFSANAGENDAIWTPTLTAADTYTVYAKWVASAENATAAQYEVTHNGGTTTVTVDQTKNSGEWVRLGEFAMTPSSGHKVILKENEFGTVVADAVLFVPSSSLTTDTVSWQATVNTGMDYDVYVHFVDNPSRSSKALFTIKGGASDIDVEVDQKNAGGTWVRIGEVTTTSTSASIELRPDGSGTASADAVWFVKKGLGASRLGFVLIDHLGTPTKIIDSTKAVAWSRTWTPFGITVNEFTGGTYATSVAFPGQMRDAETALSYNYFRDYDPSLGRYIQSDPIGLNGGLNTYGYVRGNPLIFFDINGLKIVCTSIRYPKERVGDYFRYEEEPVIGDFGIQKWKLNGKFSKGSGTTPFLIPSLKPKGRPGVVNIPKDPSEPWLQADIWIEYLWQVTIYKGTRWDWWRLTTCRDVTDGACGGEISKYVSHTDEYDGFEIDNEVFYKTYKEWRRK